MELRLFSPIDSKGKGDGECEDIEKRNEDKWHVSARRGVENSEMRHGDRGGDTQHGNRDAQRDTEPTGHAMQTHVVSSDQRGLKDEEEHPHAEDGCMKIEDMWERDGGMDEFFAYCVAEAEHHDNGDKNRHEEVEMVIEQARKLGRQCNFLDRPD